jgi:ABC-type nitrate/sulfonate/bicarbonate transport system ATPase subunit
MTVRDNVAYGLRTRKASKTEIKSRTDYFLDLVGLTVKEDAYPKELSGGMNKRVDVARAYANNPRLLLMDEPFGALDDMTKRSMQMELLRLRQTENTTIVFVTHDLDEAVFLGNKVVVLQRSEGKRPSVKDVIITPFAEHEARVDARLDDRFELAVASLRSLIHASDGEDS